jgi:uncharacterized protein YggE
MDTTFDIKKYAWIAGTFALAGIFIMSLAVAGAQLSSMKHPVGQQGTITVSGDGEVTVKPDIATVTITVRESAATVAEAQEKVESKVVAAINSLANLGVDEKDRKTTTYNVNPKYEYVSAGGYATNPKIVGYEASQTVEIKIRKIDSAGDVVGALGAANITEISGPTFTVEDPDQVQEKAKELAIKEARDKAKETARALGVDLGEVIQFSEDQGGYYPMYARDAVSTQAYGKGGALGPEVTLPTGENTVKSHVTITYNLD